MILSPVRIKASIIIDKIDPKRTTLFFFEVNVKNVILKITGNDILAKYVPGITSPYGKVKRGLGTTNTSKNRKLLKINEPIKTEKYIIILTSLSFPIQNWAATAYKGNLIQKIASLIE